MNLPPSFWPCSTDKPSQSAWFRWRKTFADFLELLPILNPTVSLTEAHKIKLLRQSLGDEGQRHFDALRIENLSSLIGALDAFGGLWGARKSIFAARYCFSKLFQKHDESADEFITRIHQAAPDCQYNEIQPTKF